MKLLIKNTLIKTLIIIFYLLITTIYSITYANQNYTKTLENYLNLKQDINTDLKLISKSEKDILNNKITILNYEFNSQKWPINSDNTTNTNTNLWTHRITVYIPNNTSSNNALLWINGGTRNPLDNKNYYNHPEYPLDFAAIANKTASIVIDLKDIPNQYIKLDNKYYIEDQLVAYTWSKFIEDPKKYEYYPAYLPMTKAVVKAMDNISKNFQINKYIISGLSKRGLTTWLTALHDDRVLAIIPAAIDILNIDCSINHIYNSHQDWPIALRDYNEHKVLDKLRHPSIEYLYQVNDPIRYIKCKNCDAETKNKFYNRTKINKYIILSSGDDFFTPDSSFFYYHKLPGVKNLRVVPNSRHFIAPNILQDSLISYIYILNNNHNKNLSKIIIPEINYNILENNKSKQNQKHIKKSTKQYILELKLNKKPNKITLYTANNPNKRDFRLAENITYNKTDYSPNIYGSYDQQKNIYTYQISISEPKEGWSAFFIETEYKLAENIPNLVLTTQAEIFPRKYPAKITKKYAKKINNKINNIKNTIKQKFHYGETVDYNTNSSNK